MTASADLLYGEAAASLSVARGYWNELIGPFQAAQRSTAAVVCGGTLDASWASTLQSASAGACRAANFAVQAAQAYAAQCVFSRAPAAGAQQCPGLDLSGEIGQPWGTIWNGQAQCLDPNLVSQVGAQLNAAAASVAAAASAQSAAQECARLFRVSVPMRRIGMLGDFAGYQDYITGPGTDDSQRRHFNCFYTQMMGLGSQGGGCGCSSCCGGCAGDDGDKQGVSGGCCGNCASATDDKQGVSGACGGGCNCGSCCGGCAGDDGDKQGLSGFGCVEGNGFPVHCPRPQGPTDHKHRCFACWWTRQMGLRDNMDQGLSYGGRRVQGFGAPTPVDVYSSLTAAQQTWIQQALSAWLADATVQTWLAANPCQGVTTGMVLSNPTALYAVIPCFQTWFNNQASQGGSINAQGILDQPTVAAIMATAAQATWGAGVGTCPNSCGITPSQPSSSSSSSSSTVWWVVGGVAIVLAGGAVYMMSRPHRAAA